MKSQMLSNTTLRFLSSLLLYYCFVVLASTAQQQKQQSEHKTRRMTSNTIEFSAQNVSRNLKSWEADMAIMFYAPWCKYCKQLAPSWDQIALLHADTKDLAIGKFDCEASRNTDICLKLKVDRYPSIYYIAYGNLNQAPLGGWFFGKNTMPRVARYNGDLYPEAVYDWVTMISKISWFQRTLADIKGIFTGRTRDREKLDNLLPRYNALEHKVQLFADELEKYKADELFDTLENHGDPFILLSQIEKPGEKDLPIRVCVGEMASEYCKYHRDDEKYCKSFMDACSKQNMSPKECRPSVCPFKERGCKVVSSCLQKSVLDQYKEALSDYKTSKTKSEDL